MSKIFFLLLFVTITLGIVGCSGHDDDFEGKECGGLVPHNDCGGNTFCQFSIGTCGAADQTGFCVSKPEVCDALFSPVCGCDGSTYSSECVAEGAGVSIVSVGSCPLIN